MTFEQWKEMCIKTFPGSPENVKKLEKFLSLFKLKEKLIKTDSVKIAYSADDPREINYQVFEVLADNGQTQYIIRWKFRNTDMNVEMGNINPDNIYLAVNSTIERHFR